MGRLRRETTRMKPEVSTREGKIANLVASGLGNLAIWAAMEAEFPQIIEEPARRKQLAGKAIPFDKDERGRVSRAINSVRGLLIKKDEQVRSIVEMSGGTGATVKNASDIQFRNRHRFSFGEPAMDFIYGHTRYIHLTDHPDSKYSNETRKVLDTHKSKPGAPVYREEKVKVWKSGLWKAGDPMIVLGDDYARTRDDKGQLLPLDLKAQKVEHGCPESFQSIWGGAPGVGKTRLAIAVSKGINRGGMPILYCNGEAEESDMRLWMGADVDDSLFNLVSADLLETEQICQWAYQIRPRAIIIDSIQMLAESKKGTSGLFRALTRFKLLKSEEAAGRPHIIFISQLNKQEELAGSRLLEHIVDAAALVTKQEGRKGVFLFEIPRKNRGGETPRGALFGHTETGVQCVSTSLTNAPIYKLTQPSNPVLTEGVHDHPDEIARDEDIERGGPAEDEGETEE